ncbi:hypothetical protein CH333_03285 [candidate division WOR-3 bacterium JGI_Cruoil_03_44_89]|uniref:Uncharacterized protein n=1 Tax=candidate division WOR-3 bacterium JGI_Cruoil_03_44_89 TaxID=1973748 RepID=A0A235BVX3_UNCW3|nr:MAG: hypothetical protein CH333_07445 [candidate division WOR-3 bacterium JGI_Cruoil_03_44_89]OYD16508.1 MAG: hypothetical protein CH333_03285 [candidate division WOR-3 bacterium JGI_Cruoil_03_44_89]
MVVGHFIVRGILKKFSLPETGFKGAGAVIGILERIFTLTLVLINQYASVALIFTAKSITRFEDLKNRKFAEYYLIGTLSSILFSVLVGILTKWFLGVV